MPIITRANNLLTNLKLNASVTTSTYKHPNSLLTNPEIEHNCHINIIINHAVSSWEWYPHLVIKMNWIVHFAYFIFIVWYEALSSSRHHYFVSLFSLHFSKFSKIVLSVARVFSGNPYISLLVSYFLHHLLLIYFYLYVCYPFIYSIILFFSLVYLVFKKSSYSES